MELVLEQCTALLRALLRALETLEYSARHVRPDRLPDLAPPVAGAEGELRAAVEALSPWPDAYADMRGALDEAADHALRALDALRVAVTETGDLGDVHRALRFVPRAQEALYRLSGLPPVSRYFLDPDSLGREERLARAPESDHTGVIHVGNEPGSRGGFSLYVPEDYDAGRACPLVMALHGGSGRGSRFLWNWLRTARSRGFILVAPTAVGGPMSSTWALTGPDPDTPNIARILAAVRENWSVDGTRLLLTGMSDGGTFSYVSGLEEASPFTHLAPVSAAFHPMLAEMASPARLRDLRIRIVHGRLDWMFPVTMAREAKQALSRAGADVSLREIADLSHCYPAEINPELAEWLTGETAAG